MRQGGGGENRAACQESCLALALLLHRRTEDSVWAIPFAGPCFPIDKGRVMVISSLYFHHPTSSAEFYCVLGDLQQLSLVGSVLLWRGWIVASLEGLDIATGIEHL